jgi:tRNA (guanine10-N2)-dimethyltransferase
MTQSLAILGRQPALGIAELESLYGAEALRPVGREAVCIDKASDEIEFTRLGGTIKLAKVLTVLDTTHWPELQDYLTKTIPQHLQYLPEDGKLQIGLSTYGLQVDGKRLLAAGLELKKVIKKTGRSVRLIPNKEPALNSAQVLHNHLTGPLGWELLLVRDGSQTILAQTVSVQDITAYAKRDQARPKRDARVGMLPPKLAQIIVNLATSSDQACVLDPFCGTGVVLQEALLMGYSAYGTDLEPRMVEYSEANLRWLRQDSEKWKLEVGDATSHQWQNFDVVAGETYLGRPFSALPAPHVLDEVMRDVDTIHQKFLRNLARQTQPGFRACIAIPAWKTSNGFKHLKTLDNLHELGYTRVSFVHAKREDLVYHRENQIVARELVILIRV